MYSILCIETATEICSVVVVTPSGVIALTENHQGNQHASFLTTLIDQALHEAGIALQQLDAIAVSKGPGSYTGLRVGVSTAKGLCYALEKPLIAIPTLQSLAAVGYNTLQKSGQTIPTDAMLLPMLDARRMEVYCAGYDINGNETRETEAKIIDETSFAEELQNGPVYFMGNGSDKCKGIITHTNAYFLNEVHCSAAGMQRYVCEAFEQKRFENVAYFEPYYLKDFVSTTPKKRP
jgi:tRNA threonylcarbamoyladenosine biosynthesis protein TsaB